MIYPLIGTASFHDITSGNSIYESTEGYSCQTGYDLVTGCGTPDVANLAAALAPVPIPVLTSAVSVQNHSGIPFPIALPLTGFEGVEDRAINGALQIVCTFKGAITSGQCYRSR